MTTSQGSVERVFATIWFASLVMLMAPRIAEAQDAVTPPGAGTAGNPYQISQLGHLVWMGENASVSTGKTYALQNDIDATGTQNWNDGLGMTPIGFQGVPFLGMFAGAGYTISNLFMDYPDRSGVGLFGHVGRGGAVNNLKLTGARISGLDNVGILAGSNEGALFGCQVSGQVTGGYQVGALMGANEGQVNHCSAEGTVAGTNHVGGLIGFDVRGMIDGCTATGTVSGYYEVGGLVGTLNRGNRMKNCSASCDVTGGDDAGGLVGFVNRGGTVIRNCSATGKVTGGNYVGGLVGLVELEGTNVCVIQGCHATGEVMAEFEGAGGLVGNILDIESVCSVIGCFATGDVSGQIAVGGLAGYSYGRLTNCYATGIATGYNMVGGLLGRNNGYVTFCYAAGPVSAASVPPAVGGLVGINEQIVESSYWDTVTSGQASSEGGTGADTAAMMQQATFEGWNFSNIWLIEEQASYPFLAARIIGVTGNLAFEDVTLGQTDTAVMTITNSGIATLTVSSIAYPPGFSGAWSGSLAAGEATNVTVTFNPVAAVSYHGTVTVNSDMTAGSDSLEVSGLGVAPPSPGQLCFAAATYAAKEGVKRKIVVRRINGSVGTVSVQYVTKAKTALAGQDYVAQSGTLTWTNGETTAKSFKLAIPMDWKKEPSETFQVRLKNPVGATLATPSKTTVTISASK